MFTPHDAQFKLGIDKIWDPMKRCSCLMVSVCWAMMATFAMAQAKPAVDDALRFGPGTVHVIDPPPQPGETFSGPGPMKEFLAANPQIDWNEPDFPNKQPFFNSRSQTLIEKAQQVTMRREVYGFEFAFKPMRQIYVDVPQPEGVMKRKLVWYFAYRLRYRGGDLRLKEVVDELGNRTYPDIESVAYKKRRAFPMFVFTNHSKKKEYLDQLLPTARDIIARREQITSPLYNTVELSTVDIPRTTAEESPGVWGYATWTDIDPTTDFFTINVYGLTNAFRVVEVNGQDEVQRKVLQLNFYRPGDTVSMLADEIRYGVPAYEDPDQQNYVLKQYGLPERLDYRWIFR